MANKKTAKKEPKFNKARWNSNDMRLTPVDLNKVQFANKPKKGK